jgi:hypothetical protein
MNLKLLKRDILLTGWHISSRSGAGDDFGFEFLTMHGHQH